jgi:hypothetical protein
VWERDLRPHFDDPFGRTLPLKAADLALLERCRTPTQTHLGPDFALFLVSTLTSKTSHIEYLPVVTVHASHPKWVQEWPAKLPSLRHHI